MIFTTELKHIFKILTPREYILNFFLGSKNFSYEEKMIFVLKYYFLKIMMIKIGFLSDWLDRIISKLSHDSLSWIPNSSISNNLYVTLILNSLKPPFVKHHTSYYWRRRQTWASNIEYQAARAILSSRIDCSCAFTLEMDTWSR